MPTAPRRCFRWEAALTFTFPLQRRLLAETNASSGGHETAERQTPGGGGGEASPGWWRCRCVARNAAGLAVVGSEGRCQGGGWWGRWRWLDATEELDICPRCISGDV